MNSIRPNKNKQDDYVNEAIPFKEMLVIDEEGNKLGIIPKQKAIDLALSKNLDLVVVSPDSKVIVAKFMDYSKFRYDQQKKQRELRKNQQVVQLKEIRLSPTIELHDLDTKLRQSIKFLNNGDKVKLSIRFRGRMITHAEVGEKVMLEFINKIGDDGIVESKPKMDGRSMIAVIAPNTSK